MTPSAQTAGGRRVRRWTRELIIEKILEWEARYGEPPCSADWNPSLARWRAQEWRAERYREGVWPSTNAAKRPFGGSFDAAIRAAGLEPRRPGPQRRAAGEARPAVEQRERRRGVRDELAARAGRRAGRARAAALERELLVAEGRAERAEAKAGDARRRARRATDQVGRARRARDRVRVAARCPQRRSSASSADRRRRRARARGRRPGRGRDARRRRGARGRGRRRAPRARAERARRRTASAG